MDGSYRHGKEEGGTSAGGTEEGWVRAGGRLLLSLYNGLVLPHLQYCLMVPRGLPAWWRDYGVGITPVLFSRRSGWWRSAISTGSSCGSTHGGFGMDGFQRLRPRCSAGWRSARAGLHVSSRDHASVGHWVPKEWDTLSRKQRGVGSLPAFKRGRRRVS